MGGGSKSKSRSSKKRGPGRPTKRQQHESRMSRGARGAYNKGFRGISAFGGAFSGGNIGDPNSPSYGQGTSSQMAAAKQHLASLKAAKQKTSAKSKITSAVGKVGDFVKSFTAKELGVSPSTFSSLGPMPSVTSRQPQQTSWSSPNFSSLASRFTASNPLSAAKNAFGMTIGRSPLGLGYQASKALSKHVIGPSVDWAGSFDNPISRGIGTLDNTWTSLSTYGKSLAQQAGLTNYTFNKPMDINLSPDVKQEKGEVTQGWFSALPKKLQDQIYTSGVIPTANLRELNQALNASEYATTDKGETVSEYYNTMNQISDVGKQFGEGDIQKNQDGTYTVRAIRDNYQFDSDSDFSVAEIGNTGINPLRRINTIASGIGDMLGAKDRAEQSGNLSIGGYSRDITGYGVTKDTIRTPSRLSFGTETAPNYGVRTAATNALSTLGASTLGNLSHSGVNQNINKGIPQPGTAEWNALSPNHQNFWSKQQNIDAMRELNLKRDIAKHVGTALDPDSTGPLGNIVQKGLGIAREMGDDEGGTGLTGFVGDVYRGVTNPVTLNQSQWSIPGMPHMALPTSWQGAQNIFTSRSLSEMGIGSDEVTSALADGRISLNEVPGMIAGAIENTQTEGTKANQSLKTLAGAAEFAGGALSQSSPGAAVKRAVGEAFGYDDRGRLRSSSGPTSNRDLAINQLAPSLRSSSDQRAQATNTSLTDWLGAQQTARQGYTDELARLTTGRADTAKQIADYEKQYDDKIDPGILGSWDTALTDVQKQQSDFDAAQRSALVSYQQQQDIYNRPTTWGVRGLENLARSPKQAFGRRERAKRKTTTQTPTISNLAATWGSPMTLNV